MRLYRRKDKQGRPGKVWWVYFLDRDGKKQRVSTKQEDRVRARAVAHDIERRLASPTYRASHETTVGDALKRVMVECENEDLSKATIGSYKTKARNVARVLGADTALAKIVATTLDGYVAARKVEGAKRHTIHKELVMVRKMLKSALRRGEYDLQLAQVMPKLRTGYKPVERHIVFAKWSAVLDAIPSTSRAAMIAFMLATGCRRSEAEHAHREDVDLTEGTVVLYGTKTRRSHRTILITSLVRPFIERALADAKGERRLFTAWSGEYVAQLDAGLKSAGLPHMSPNDLRRSYTTAHTDLGVPPEAMVGQLGHADERMIRRVYGQTGAVKMRGFIEARLAAAGVHPAYTANPDAADSEESTEENLSAGEGVSVPRDGIEPPTRGFSSRRERRTSPRKTAPSNAGVHQASTEPPSQPVPPPAFCVDFDAADAYLSRLLAGEVLQ